MIEKVLELEPNVSARSIKNVTINEQLDNGYLTISAAKGLDLSLIHI